jgi:protein-L-isoaspartate(D-aspartate) O-methyltransferase
MKKSNIEKTRFWRARQQMVRYHLMAREIEDKNVLKAMEDIPREKFVPEALQERAYDDMPLPISEGQTISQPYIVALMTQLLKLEGREKVLEIGTGSGYQTAILASLCARVFSIERSAQLSAQARKILEQLGFSNVLLRLGDGTVGWDEFAPYDRIIVTAGAPSVPKSLIRQLKMGGLLVIPVGDRWQQELQVLQRSESGYETGYAGGCVFVPLIGREGWQKE